MCREMMDAMRQSRKMTKVSFFSWCWNIVLLLPHSIAIVLAFPNLILSQGAPCPALPCPALPLLMSMSWVLRRNVHVGQRNC